MHSLHDVQVIQSFSRNRYEEDGDEDGDNNNDNNDNVINNNVDNKNYKKMVEINEDRFLFFFNFFYFLFI